MKSSTRLILIVVAIVVVLTGIIWAAIAQSNRPDKLDGFASCLEEKGAKFYGAFWCAHCQNQKKMFGRSARLLPYIECSQPSGNGQLSVCIDNKIESYPTWEFADGERLTGEVPLSTLAEKTQCALPQQ